MVAGAAVALIAWLMIDTDWNMLVAMMLMMVAGMLICLLLALPTIALFGAMEVMLPMMLTGMISGMATAMWLAMIPLILMESLLVGSAAGLVTIVAIWITNSRVRGLVQLPRE